MNSFSSITKVKNAQTRLITAENVYGEKGKGGKALQYGSYVFYPLHMLILWLL